MSMSNSKEKSRGILAFAFNTDSTDYISIANRTLSVASKTLGLPYTLITTEQDGELQNSRFDIDKNQFVQWKNFGRWRAYDLSPYDETLVIDVDYLILDQKILDIFQLEWDYLLQRNTHTLTDTWPDVMGQNSLPFVWATVFAFRKTPRAQMFFDLVARIQKNYHYYRRLYNVTERIYRNDYAFAIADIVLDGYR